MSGDRINSIRHADNTVIFAECIEGLQHLVDMKQLTICLEININKTKLMVISKTSNKIKQLTIHKKPVDQEVN